MTVTATLSGSATPQAVQIVVSETTIGEPWTVTGEAGDMQWIVPGGQGVGDGGQLVLADNRGPLNVPITYRYFEGDTMQSAPPLMREHAGDIVIQTPDGQRSVTADLMYDSAHTDIEVRNALFSVPGRRHAVSRSSTTGAGGGALVIRVHTDSSEDFQDVFEPGGALIWLLGARSFDLSLVQAFTVTSAQSRGIPEIEKREWTLAYRLADDPFLDSRLGIFSWVDFDDAMSAREWDEFDTLFTGLPWNDFDTQDWSIL